MVKLTVKNIASLCVYAAALSSCIYYKAYASCALFEIWLPFMGVYFIIDMRNEPNIQYRIHHIVCLIMFVYGYYYRVKLDDAGILLYTILKTELSSVFLLFMPMLDTTTYLYHINNVVFSVCFTKTRIIDMYYGLIRPESLLYTLVDKYTPENKFASGALIASCYGLYGLNLYWFTIILRHIYSAVIHLWKQNKHEILYTS